jgi:hypothetical protein
MGEWLSGQASSKVRFLSLSFILIRPTHGDGRLEGFIRTAVVQGDEKGVERERVEDNRPMRLVASFAWRWSKETRRGWNGRGGYQYNCPTRRVPRCFFLISFSSD